MKEEILEIKLNDRDLALAIYSMYRTAIFENFERIIYLNLHGAKKFKINPFNKEKIFNIDGKTININDIVKNTEFKKYFNELRTTIFSEFNSIMVGEKTEDSLKLKKYLNDVKNSLLDDNSINKLFINNKTIIKKHFDEYKSNLKSAHTKFKNNEKISIYETVSQLMVDYIIPEILCQCVEKMDYPYTQKEFNEYKNLNITFRDQNEEFCKR